MGFRPHRQHAARCRQQAQRAVFSGLPAFGEMPNPEEPPLRSVAVPAVAFDIDLTLVGNHHSFGFQVLALHGTLWRFQRKRNLARAIDDAVPRDV